MNIFEQYMNECCIYIALYCVLFIDSSLQWKRCFGLISRRLQCFWSERVINRQLGSHRSGTEHTLWVCIFLSATVFSAAPCLAPLSWFIQDFQFSRDASQYLILCVSRASNQALRWWEDRKRIWALPLCSRSFIRTNTQKVWCLKKAWELNILQQIQ